MRIKTKNFKVICLLLISIFPVVTLSGFIIPVLALFTPLLLLYCFDIYVMQNDAKLEIVSQTKRFFYLIILDIVVFSLLVSWQKLDVISFPSDVIQYIIRMIIFYYFFKIIWRNGISAEDFARFFLIITTIGMLVGILQWIPWPGREYIIRLYPFGVTRLDSQLNQLSNNLSGIRVHGIAQHATANGGLAMFFAVYAISILKYYKKHRLLAIICTAFSVINIFASQARGGILALAFAVFLFYFVDLFLKKIPLSSLKYLMVVLACAGGFYVLYIQGNAVISKMVYRWDILFQSSGGARVTQVEYFLEQMNSLSDVLFGLSKQVVNESAISYGVEIEFINIFITYGLVGFILQYGLVILLSVYFFKKIKRFKHDPLVSALGIASFIGLLSYQIFSVSYYFFREIRSGLIPWILFGATVGVCELAGYIKDNNQSTSNAISE